MDQRTELAALRIAANKLLQACEVVPKGSLSAEFVRDTFKDSLPEAAQSLQAQEGGGWVLVPRVPTEAMLAEGHRNIDWCRDDQNTNVNEHPSQTDLGGTSCKTDLSDAYAAMLTAAPAPIEQEG